MSLVEHVDHLRGLADLDRDTTLLQMATLNVLEELAVAVDLLVAEHPRPGGAGPAGGPPLITRPHDWPPDKP
jgi:hypothetical protein